MSKNKMFKITGVAIIAIIIIIGILAVDFMVKRSNDAVLKIEKDKIKSMSMSTKNIDNSSNEKLVAPPQKLSAVSQNGYYKISTEMETVSGKIIEPKKIVYDDVSDIELKNVIIKIPKGYNLNRFNGYVGGDEFFTGETSSRDIKLSDIIQPSNDMLGGFDIKFILHSLDNPKENIKPKQISKAKSEEISNVKYYFGIWKPVKLLGVTPVNIGLGLSAIKSNVIIDNSGVIINGKKGKYTHRSLWSGTEGLLQTTGLSLTQLDINNDNPTIYQIITNNLSPIYVISKNIIIINMLGSVIELKRQ